MLKNIKVIRSIILMVILSTIMSLSIAVIGYGNMRSINNNSSLMYEDALIKIIKAEDIRETFSGIRMNVDRLTIGDFNEDDVKNIDNYNSTINNDLYVRSTKVFFITFIIGFILMIFVSFTIISVIKNL